MVANNIYNQLVFEPLQPSFSSHVTGLAF